MKSRVFTTSLFLMILTMIVSHSVTAQTSTGIVITKLNLKSTLENLGYETVDLGSDTYQIKLVQGASVPISVVLSADGSRIWLITNLGDKVLSNLNSERLIKMLQSNRNIGTSFFAINSNRLEMLSVVENRNMTPVILRKAIELQTRNVANTVALWDEGKVN
ncbi:hypothetical protein GZH53_05375 [Flavihumibacter sp. R14]|nr:hypothetical protein [Flavihumibacter soli]